MLKYRVWLLFTVLVFSACSENSADGLLSTSDAENQLVTVYVDKYLGREIKVPLYSLHDTLYAGDYAIGSVRVPENVYQDQNALIQFMAEYEKDLDTFNRTSGEYLMGEGTEMMLTYYNITFPTDWCGVIIYENGNVEYRYDSKYVLVVARNTDGLPRTAG